MAENPGNPLREFLQSAPQTSFAISQDRKGKLYIFFYGTLQPGGNLNFFEEKGLDKFLKRVGKATVRGELTHLRNRTLNQEYPAIVNVGKTANLVHGTIYEILDESVFVTMDEHEGFDSTLSPSDSNRHNFYQRQTCKAMLDETGETLDVQLYVLNINSGKYKSEVIEDKGLVSISNWLEQVRHAPSEARFNTCVERLVSETSYTRAAAEEYCAPLKPKS